MGGQLQTNNHDYLYSVPDAARDHLRASCGSDPSAHCSRHRCRLLDATERNPEDISGTPPATSSPSAAGVRSGVDAAVWPHGVCGVSRMECRREQFRCEEGASGQARSYPLYDPAGSEPHLDAYLLPFQATYRSYG